ncbi:MAG: hypothetical protein IT374_15030 [Polyangiaceae bacterium]|nr:hypothetical protein [Polyangiaceae bacterium]
MAIRGLWGRPYLCLEPLLDLSTLPAVHEEVCLALTQAPLQYTGGSHRSMGITPPSREDDCLVDYAEVIAGMSDEQFETFRQLADDPASLDPARRRLSTFGEEREHPLSRRQMAWLKIRFGVYFPWKGYLELIPNRDWGDKANPEGKAFTGVARALLPKTIALVRSLPFLHIGRCNVMGLEAHDHGTVHRDGDPAEQTEPDHFITLCPSADKRLFVWDDDERREIPVEGRAIWFNDHDYHGVSAAPYFRYSIRVDGVFEPEFLERVARAAR